MNQNYNKLLPQTSQNGYYQKIYKQKMLERMWRKGNPPALLVGMYIDTATMENSMEIPLKTRNKTTMLLLLLLSHFSHV